MRISLNWVARLLNVARLPLAGDVLMDRLTRHVAEIDELETTGPDVADGVVIGKVLSCAQHPNADKLRVTTVDVGADAPLPIVCGAPNIARATVAMATGTVLNSTDYGNSSSLPSKANCVANSHGVIWGRGLGAAMMASWSSTMP